MLFPICHNLERRDGSLAPFRTLPLNIQQPRESNYILPIDIEVYFAAIPE